MGFLLILAIITIILLIIIFVFVRKYTYTLLKQSDTYKALDSLDHLIATTYCGVNKSPATKDTNHGPVWRKTPADGCETWDGQQDFWLSGNVLDSILNLVVITGKTTKSINKVLDGVFETDTLLYQLIHNTNGAWNDDRLWYAISFARLYQHDSQRFSKGLDWAMQIFHDIYTKYYNSFVCNGKTWYSTWWQVLPNDPHGLISERNTITNSLFLELTVLLHDSGNQQNSQNVIYQQVIENSVDFLSTLKNGAGLIKDGWNILNGKCEAETAKMARIFTYNQGVLLDGFTRAAKLYHSLGNLSKRDEVLSFVFSLISAMTNPVPNNPVIRDNGKQQPTLFDQDYNNSSQAFKGIYCKYLAYASQELVKLSLSKEQLTILRKAKDFISKNAQWLYQNGQRDLMYPFQWQSTKAEVAAMPVDTLTTATTFSAIDLFTCDYKLRSLQL